MKNLVNQIIFVVIYCISVSKCRSNGYSVEIEHAFGDGEFQKRGEIIFPNLKGEDAEIQQNQFTETDLELLKELSNKNELYRVRILSNLRAEEKRDWIYSFCFARDLISSNLQDEITIHTDGLGNLISINIQCSETELSLNDENQLETSLNIVTPSLAPVPDTAGFIIKLEDEQRKKEIQAKEPQSFLGKYWMYILPIVIFMMMSNASQQQ